MLKWRQLKFDD
uniref:Uncharacterized protein n=1 Tax=Anguilla anguilla TaxID=7936 RepID=A0A0E9W0E9_ANGAN